MFDSCPAKSDGGRRVRDWWNFSIQRLLKFSILIQAYDTILHGSSPEYGPSLLALPCPLCTVLMRREDIMPHPRMGSSLRVASSSRRCRGRGRRYHRSSEAELSSEGRWEEMIYCPSPTAVFWNHFSSCCAHRRLHKHRIGGDCHLLKLLRVLEELVVIVVIVIVTGQTFIEDMNYQNDNLVAVGVAIVCRVQSLGELRCCKRVGLTNCC